MRRPTHTLAAALAAWLFALAFAGAACATATARLEYMRNGFVYSAEVITSTGASVQSSAAPTGSAFVRVTVTAGALILTPAATSPTATQTNGVLVQTCTQPVTVVLQAGQKVAIIEAATPNGCATGGGGGGGSLSAQANAAAQSSSEGATTDPLSMDLHRSLRVLNQDVNGNAIDTSPCTPGGAASAASTNATNIKNAPGTWCGGLGINVTGTVVYLRLYNLAAAPTCSSSTGFVASIPIPASTAGAGTPLNFAGAFGATFTAGIGYCLTGGGGNTDNTNAVTGVYLTWATK